MVMYGTSYACQWISAFVGFPEVAKILYPILIKNNLKSELVLKASPHFVAIDLHKKMGGNVKWMPIEKDIKIATEKDVRNFGDYLMKFYQDDVRPFFEKWPNVQALAQAFENIPQDDLEDYFGDYTTIFTKAVVWRLCNHPKYSEYIDWLVQTMKDDYDEEPDEVNLNYYAAAKDFKEKLNSTQPIYM